jgi:tRNA pseudouridine38-40 synthase
VARTLKLTIAYDGTDFAGWQRQATDRTVQAAIEDALAPIEGSDRVVITGAGRTDAGVHAAGQVASVKLQAAMSIDTLQRALNATLPPDVRIMAVDEMAEDFNAQFAAKRKTYRYVLWSSGVVPPQLRRYAWHVPHALDIDAMNAAARELAGTHDFAAFQAAGGDVVTTVRTVFQSQTARIESNASVRPVLSAAGVLATAPGDLLIYEIVGSGFLRHMVRNIVGTLVDIGRARRTVDDMRAILASKDRGRASATAPPHGLTLWSVDY